MSLGVLSLFQQRGLFYKEEQWSSNIRFSDMESSALAGEELLEPIFNRTKQHRVTPVDESGDTEYITTIYEDDGHAKYPYQLTVWLLVEEIPEEI